MNIQLSSMPKILIIIVTWNKKEHVLGLLESIKTLDYPKPALDIIIVDNASSDGTAQAITARHPEVTLLYNAENLGGTGGFNTGLRWALKQPEGRYDYWWLLDNDVKVHCHALTHLVEALVADLSIGVVGSTMMQLDYPWRINEMGCIFKRSDGMLELIRHHEEILAWREYPLEQLLQMPCDLTQILPDCQMMEDVEYVAAASLLVRPEVVRAVGLWEDFFIHYDDVEWCLRIAAQGWRIVAVTNSLIWHVSAVSKVPTWVLYYDNRNVLAVIKRHVNDSKVLDRALAYTLKKGLYYTLMGKPDLGRLHSEAAYDFLHHRFGKKNIVLQTLYRPHQELLTCFATANINRVLVAFTVDEQIIAMLKQVFARYPDLRVDFMLAPGCTPPPNAPPKLLKVPTQRWLRWYFYLSLRNRYDVVIQTDYQMLMALSWLNAKLLFINSDSFCINPKPRLRDVWRAGISYLKVRLFRRL